MKRYFYLTLLNLFMLSISLYAQPKLAAGYKYNEKGAIHMVDSISYPETLMSYKVYDDTKVLALDQGENEFKAADIYGFTLKESGKRFVSATLAGVEQSQFVEDLTPSFKKMKVVKSFFPDEPLMQKDSVVMGSWLHYIMLTKDDGKRILVSGYKKIAEYVKNDCPELSKKISAKEKGYFLGLMKGTPEEELEIYNRIAAEYNACKK